MIQKIKKAITCINNLLLTSQFKYFTFFTTSLFLLCFLFDTAMARAGGGGGFSGGSSGGGSFGGGSSGGSGGGSFLLFYLIFRYPYIGIPAVIIIAILSYHGSKGAKSGHISRTIRRGYQNQIQNNLNENIAKIKEQDSDFSVSSLTERISSAFKKVQNGWAEQNIANIRHIVSDGIFERFSIQLSMQKSSEIVNRMDNIQILNAQLVAAESDHYFDTVHFLITASASDYYTRLNSEKVIYGTKTPDTFTEYWSFLRRPGAKTLQGKGLMEGFCPNCGTPLKISESVICPSCNAIVNSGEYDWVLAEITQPEEWRIKPSVNIAGFQEMLEKDPSFNVQHIEDKASVIFYRNIASAFFAADNYIAKLANENFLKKHSSEYQKDKQGRCSFYADAAIGCAEVIEIVTSDNLAEKDKIRVKIKWAGHPATAKIPSYIPPCYEENRIYTQEFILVRNGDVKSSDKNILSSTHCPNCGAPQTSLTIDKCEYCGAILNDGSYDWVLDDITFFNGYPEMSHMQSLSFKDNNSQQTYIKNFDNESIVSCCAAVMMIDGEISDDESKLLPILAANHNISQERLDMLINSVKEHGLHIPAPKSKEEAQEFLKCMVQMCLIDGKVTSKEKQLIKQLMSKTGYTDIDLNLMIKRERTEMYKIAKQINKQ